MLAERSVLARRLTLLTAAGLIAAFWLVVLPRWAASPGVRGAIDRNAARGIDPAALYYTDHPREWARPDRQKPE